MNNKHLSDKILSEYEKEMRQVVIHDVVHETACDEARHGSAWEEEKVFETINMEALLSDLNNDEILPLDDKLSLDQQRRIEDKIFAALYSDKDFSGASIGWHDDVVGAENASERETRYKNKVEIMPYADGRKKRRKKGYLVVLAAAIIAAFGITAGAAVELDWDTDLLEFMGIENVDTLNLGDGHVDMEVLCTCCGIDYRDNPQGEQSNVTMMVTESIGDNRDIYVRIDTDFEVPEDFNPETDYIMPVDFSLTTYKRNPSNSKPISSVFSAMCEDGRLYFLLSLSADEEVNDVTIRLRLGDLYWYHDLNTKEGQDTQPKQLIYDGAWQLEWEYDYKTPEKTYYPKQMVTVDGVDISIDKVVIAPLGVHLYGTKASDQEEMKLFDVGDFAIEKVTCKDGTVIVPTGIDHMGIYQGKEIDVHVDVEGLGVGLDVDNVESITVEGVEIKLKRRGLGSNNN